MADLIHARHLDIEENLRLDIIAEMLVRQKGLI